MAGVSRLQYTPEVRLVRVMCSGRVDPEFVLRAFANGMDQLAQAMMQIKQASSQTAATMKQTEQSVRDLLEMAQQMEAAVGDF